MPKKDMHTVFLLLRSYSHHSSIYPFMKAGPLQPHHLLKVPLLHLAKRPRNDLKVPLLNAITVARKFLHDFEGGIQTIGDTRLSAWKSMVLQCKGAIRTTELLFYHKSSFLGLCSEERNNFGNWHYSTGCEAATCNTSIQKWVLVPVLDALVLIQLPTSAPGKTMEMAHAL